VFAWLWVENRRRYREERENRVAKLVVREMEKIPETKPAHVG
jgi:hypothetical protein